MNEYFDYVDLTWPEVEALPRDTPLVVPLGTGFDLEQLRQQLDSPARTGILPIVPFGWQGSGIEVPRILLGRYLSNLLGSLQKQGFSRGYVLTDLDSITLLAPSSILHQELAPLRPVLMQHRTSAIGGMGHAGELETSLMLHLQPALCHMDRVVDETDFIATSSYYMDWIEGGSLIANPPWDDDTRTGAYGAGSHGTAEKGKLWLAAAIEDKAGHVPEIQEQHPRREARREAGYGRGGPGRS